MLVVAGCFVLLVPLALGLPASGTKYSYDGHKLLKIFHNTPEDYRKLVNSELKYGLDFWKLPRHQNDSMVVNVPPHYLHAFLDELKNMNAHVTVMVNNLQQMLDEVETDSVHHRRRRAISSKNFDFLKYNTFDTIDTYLDNLAQDQSLPDGLVTLQTIGNTTEGRPIKVLKISTGASANKKKIFIDGGIHAREWISPATVLYFINQLTSTDVVSPEIDLLLTRFDVYLVPVLNPDGYAYSHSNQRFWRKNRSPPPNGNCYGVDLNRNFPFQWNPYIGGSTNNCQDIYSGRTAGSELETQALVNFLTTNGADMVAYLTIHSYGQMWLYPWGYTSTLPGDWQDLDAAAWIATRHLKRVFGTEYVVGAAANVLYSAAGGSDDYAKGEAGIKYSYTLELRDNGVYGFALPESQILPTCIETFSGFLDFTKFIYSQMTTAHFAG